MFRELELSVTADFVLNEHMRVGGGGVHFKQNQGHSAEI